MINFMRDPSGSLMDPETEFQNVPLLFHNVVAVVAD